MPDFGPEAEDAFRARIKEVLGAHTARPYVLGHGDLGYGFGGWSKEFLREMGDLGWIGLLWPEDLGGRGLPPRALWALLGELAYGRAPAEALFYSLAVGQCIVRYGQPELMIDLLPLVIAGEVTFCEALTEPGSGSDLFSLHTVARESGDSYILEGQKTWISNGVFADYAMVLARTSDKPKAKGMSCFIVDLSSEGVERRAIRDINGEPSFSEIFFDGVDVPGHHILGGRDEGLPQVLDALEWDRFWARSVKAPFLKRELEDLLAFVKDPTQGNPLWDHEWVRMTIAELSIAIEVCDALFEDALDLMAPPQVETSADIAAAKVFADALGQHFYEAVANVLGIEVGPPSTGPDSSLGTRIWKSALSSHGLRIAGGTPEIQEATVATRGLGLARNR